mgnify:CR=1 FL=1
MENLKNIRQAALILMYDQKNKAILFQLRDDKPNIAFPNMYTFPGGVVEKDETPLNAAVRELEEETGYEIAVDNLRQFEVITYISLNDKKPIQKLIFVCLYNNESEIVCNEGQEMVFLTRNEIVEALDSVVPDLRGKILDFFDTLEALTK